MTGARESKDPKRLLPQRGYLLIEGTFMRKPEALSGETTNLGSDDDRRSMEYEKERGMC